MIGIGITTTPERELMFKSIVHNWEKYKPEGSVLVIHSDAAHKGVAYSKNQCLKNLYEQGCDHIFLFDDDCYPIKKDWDKPYVESLEHHLMYQFKLPNKPANDMRELYRDEYIVAYSHTRGAMIYIAREVLDMVGGMDERYGKGGFEHPDWTNRIYNAGLTTYRAMDVPNSHELLYCLDQDGLVESTIKKPPIKNALLYRRNMNSKEYVEFR